MPQTLTLGRWREDDQFEAHLSYIVRSCLKKQTRQTKKPFPLFRATKLREFEAVGNRYSPAGAGGTVGPTPPKVV